MDTRPHYPQAGVKRRGAEKMARLPIKIVPIAPAGRLRKPEWIRAAFPGMQSVRQLTGALRETRPPATTRIPS